MTNVGTLPVTPVTHEQYDALLACYREFPADHARAARAAHITPRSAEEVFRVGVAMTPWGQPISAVLAAEATTARAAVVRATMQRQGELEGAAQTAVQQQVDQAIVDLATVRLGEAKMVQTLRQFAMAAMVAMAPVRQAMPILYKKIADHMKRPELTAKEAIYLIKDIEEVARTVSEQAKIAIELERKVFGEPDLRIQVQPGEGGAGNLDVEQALEEIREAAKAADRVKRSSGVIDTTATEVT